MAVHHQVRGGDDSFSLFHSSLHSSTDSLTQICVFSPSLSPPYPSDSLAQYLTLLTSNNFLFIPLIIPSLSHVLGSISRPPPPRAAGCIKQATLEHE